MMRKFSLALSLLLWSFAALAQSTVSQVPGTTTNDQANPGNLGEYIYALGGSTISTVTITIATPAIVTWTNHGLVTGSPVTFTTTSALPTGITAGTTYYVVLIDVSRFNIATSVDNALAGTLINTTGSQSGIQTGTNNTNLVTTVSKNVGGISLTAGDWDVSAICSFLGAAGTTVSYTQCSVSTTSATINANIGLTSGAYLAGGTPFPSIAEIDFPVPKARVNIAVPTTVYLVVNSGFGVSTLSAGGIIRARRMR